MHQLPSQIVAKYEVLSLLGEGGMGAVYKVRHRLLDEVRVVKVIRSLHATDLRVQRRFRREARAAIRLRHPNIAHIFDFGISADGRAHLEMELIEGVTFKDILDRPDESDEPRPPGAPAPELAVELELAIELSLQALAALAYLHGQGYVHRDVAPDNLMLSRSFDGLPRVKLIDLGLVRRQTESVEVTVSGTFVGKVRYASPELFRRPLVEPSPASDLYSFGLVLYELLTGVCPVEGSSFEELMAAHLLHPVTSFAVTDPDSRIPRGLRAVIMKSLDKDASKRFASATEFAEAIRPYRGQTEIRYDDLAPRCRPVPPTESAVAALREAPTVVAGRPAANASAALPLEPTRALRAGKSWRPSRYGLLAALVVGALSLTGLILSMRDSSPSSDVVSRSSGVEPTRPTDRPAAAVGGRLVIEAQPWAEIVAITDASGATVPLTEKLITPTLLSLPTGSYTFELRHPDSPTARRLAVRAPATGTTRHSVEFPTPTTDAYFANLGLSDALAKAGS